MLKENERIDIVPGTDFKIIQNKERFSYGTDAIFLSDFTKGKGVVVDLGTGTGIIPLRIYGKDKVDIIYGVEIQKEVAQMAKRRLWGMRLSSHLVAATNRSPFTRKFLQRCRSLGFIGTTLRSTKR